MQGLGGIRCRASALERPAQITLVCEGSSVDREMLPDGREYIWPDSGQTLTGAYVAAEGMLLMTTGEDARRAFLLRAEAGRRAELRARADASRAAAEREEDRPGEMAHEETPAGPEKEHTEAQRACEAALPQRRWPPPPCWPQARYAQGRWQAP